MASDLEVCQMQKTSLVAAMDKVVEAKSVGTAALDQSSGVAASGLVNGGCGKFLFF